MQPKSFLRQYHGIRKKGERMRLVMINGGLGNQLFQYIFMRYIEETSGESCILEDLEFFTPDYHHNGFEIDRIFPVKPKRLSELLERDVLDEMLRITLSPITPGGKKKNILKVFQDCGVNLFPVQEGLCFTGATDYDGSIFSVPMNEFSPGIRGFSGDIYYYGYWINANWLAAIGEKILNELTFPPLPDEKNRAYMEQIQSLGESSVAVHIRRGDFVKIGWTVPPEFYAEEVFPEVRKNVKHPVFFMFSDDMQWVREHLNELGFLPSDTVIFVEGNMGGKNYIDMQLMHACRGMVISKSSFSYLASLLNTREDKLVWSPTPWRANIQYSRSETSE